jgi:hypothetical protein
MAWTRSIVPLMKNLEIFGRMEALVVGYPKK